MRARSHLLALRPVRRNPPHVEAWWTAGEGWTSRLTLCFSAFGSAYPDVVRPPGCEVSDGGDPDNAGGVTGGAVGASTGRADSGTLRAVFTLI